jgi:hypothetical protein
MKKIFKSSLSKFKFLILILVLNQLYYSCKKKDTESPIIILESPARNDLVFSYPEQILIKGSVSDNNKIEQIRIVVKNTSNNQVVLNPILVNIDNNNPVNFEERIRLNDIKMPSGKYFISIEATDGENFSYQFVEFFYGEANKLREGLLQVSGTENETEIILYNEDFEFPNTLKIFNYGSNGVAYSAYDQSMAIAGNKNNPFNIFLINDFSSRFNLPSLNEPFFDYFTSLDYHNQYFYLGRYDNKLNGYSTFGTSNFSSTLIGGFYPTKVLFYENQIITSLRTIDNQQKRVATFFMTGELKNQKNIDIDVLDIVQEATNKVLFIGNNSSNIAKAYTYNTESNSMFSSANISACGKFIKAYYLSPNYIILAGSNGLFRFNPVFQTISPLYSVNNIVDFDYDVVNQQLVVASNQEIMVFDISNFNILKSFVPSRIPKRIFVHYNK